MGAYFDNSVKDGPDTRVSVLKARLVLTWPYQVALAIESGFATANVPLGFGQHIWVVDPRNLSQISYQALIGGTFSIIAVILAKMSFGMTLLRLVDGKTRYVVWFLVLSTSIIGGIGAIFLWVQCNPVVKNWQPMLPGTCWDPRVNVNVGIAGGIYSALTDWALALLPWKIIWGLQMKKKEKVGVGIAMSMGIL